MRAPSWLLILGIAVLIAISGREAGAQAFKPRSTGKPGAAATSSKKPKRTAAPRRAVTTKPKPKKARGVKRDRNRDRDNDRAVNKRRKAVDDYMEIIDEDDDE
ncbi:MAG: hypothetical protein AB7P03_04585 [Kofleriaceae bacterium]